MEAPTGGLSPEQFKECIKNHVEKNYQKKENLNEYFCKTCNSDIITTTCFVSMHSKSFSGCVGEGKVEQVPLLYCPKCEGVPKRTSTCVHS
jgi:hypothetical protein